MERIFFLDWGEKGRFFGDLNFELCVGEFRVYEGGWCREWWGNIICKGIKVLGGRKFVGLEFNVIGKGMIMGLEIFVCFEEDLIERDEEYLKGFIEVISF